MSAKEYYISLVIMFVIGISMMTAMIFMGVNEQAKEEVDNQSFCNDCFTVIEKSEDGLLVYDNETKIEYYVSEEGNMTVLFDNGGAPKQYERNTGE